LRKLIPLTFAAALLLAAGGVDVTAQSDTSENAPTVAVMDFTGFMLGQSGNSAPVGKAVSSMLVTELSERDGMRVIERSQLQDLLEEQRLALSGRVDESTAIEVGKMLGVQYMIFGNVTNIGEQVRLDMRAVNVETSEVLEVQKLTDPMDQLLSLVVKMADLFAAKLELDPPSARPDIGEIPVQATIHFSRGVDFEDQGENEQAIEMYEKTLEAYPDHRGAQKALERLTSEGGA
jgi:TolB-like protein